MSLAVILEESTAYLTGAIKVATIRADASEDITCIAKLVKELAQKVAVIAYWTPGHMQGREYAGGQRNGRRSAGLYLLPPDPFVRTPLTLVIKLRQFS